MAIAFVVFAALAVTWIVLKLHEVELPFVNAVGGPGGGVNLLVPLAGIVTGLAFCCGLLLLLRTPAGPALSAVLSPMGRMALTNYLSATALFLVAGPLLGIDSPADLPQIVGLTIGIIVVQAVWSVLWLRSSGYGPAECGPGAVSRGGGGPRSGSGRSFRRWGDCSCRSNPEPLQPRHRPALGRAIGQGRCDRFEATGLAKVDRDDRSQYSRA